MAEKRKKREEFKAPIKKIIASRAVIVAISQAVTKL